MLGVLPSLPVPEITMARGAGWSCAENQARSRRFDQNPSGTGRAQGNLILISDNGTVAGSGALSCGGVPKIVALSPAESARPVGAPAATTVWPLSVTSAGSALAKTPAPSARASSAPLITDRFKWG